MSTVRLAVRRIRARPVLSALLVTGLAVAIALPAAIPVYADGATARVLADQDFEDIGYRPPFAYLFWYSAALAEPVDWTDVAQADAYLSGEGLDDLGLPAVTVSSFVDTERFVLPSDGPSGGSGATYVRLAALGDLADRVHVEGRLPSPVGDGQPIEAVLSRPMAEEAGLVVGDRLELGDVGAGLGLSDDPRRPVSISVVGIWEAAEPDDPTWIIHPDQLVNRAFVDRTAITDVLSPAYRDLISTAAWYTILDASRLSARDVDGLIAAAGRVRSSAIDRLPGIDLTVDPIDGLVAFGDRAEALSRRLSAYAIPAMVLVVVFLALIVSLTTNERRSELAILRSRGASRAQLVNQVAVEVLILSAVAVVIGVFASVGIAAAMGRTQTFLDLSGDRLRGLSLAWPAWRTGLTFAAVAATFMILPVVGASRATVATHAGLAASASGRPWWQRASLDLVVVAVTVALGWVFVRSEPTLTTEVLEDPVFVLFPALASLTVALVILRLLPVAYELAARALGRTSSVVALVAARRAARNPGSTTIPLLLLVVTISLGIFTASLAATLDLQLYDESYHRVGADWSVIEYDSAAQPVVRGVEFPRKLAPIEAFESIPGIEQATRVGAYSGRIGRQGSSAAPVTFFGIDAASFSDVAFYRADYAAEQSVPDAIATLAASPDAVLVDPTLGLAIGDEVELEVLYEGNRLDRRVVVAGHLAGFPTWSADHDDALVVGNLAPVFAGTGEAGGYHVWMRAEPGASPGVDGMLETEIGLLDQQSPLVDIPDALSQPERQGVFGLLTVGFLAAIALSILGFFFATLFKVRTSAVELGVLQALGLTPRRVAAIVVGELSLLVGGGLLAGLAVGWLLASRLIVYLVGASGLSATPALIAETDRSAVVLVTLALIALFAVTAGVLVLVLRRMRVFEALKLGETV